MKQAIIIRFRITQGGSSYEELLAMNQEASMGDFRNRFEQVSTLLSNIPEELLIGAFVNGLQDEIKAEVHMMEAQTLLQAMNWAQKIEDKNKVLDRIREEKAGQTLVSENQNKAMASDRAFVGGLGQKQAEKDGWVELKAWSKRVSPQDAWVRCLR